MCALLEQHCDDIEVVGTSDDVPSAVKMINKLKPDLVFLDIEMPGYTGFQLLDFFEEVNFQIIFTTAYSDYALQAFQVSAIDYLLKPIEISALRLAVEKADQREHGARPIEKARCVKSQLESQLERSKRLRCQ